MCLWEENKNAQWSGKRPFSFPPPWEGKEESLLPLKSAQNSKEAQRQGESKPQALQWGFFLERKKKPKWEYCVFGSVLNQLEVESMTFLLLSICTPPPPKLTNHIPITQGLLISGQHTLELTIQT